MRIDLSILHEPLYGMVAFALSPIKKEYLKNKNHY